MGASLIHRNYQTLKGFLLVEHLAALGVIIIAVGWLVLLLRTYQHFVVPVRRETTAYYAARVALVRLPPPGGKTTVTVGPDSWQVEVGPKEVKVYGDKQEQTFSFTH